MPDLMQEKINILAWILLEEASKVLNLSSKTVKEHCKSGKLGFKIEKTGHKLNYLIYVGTLPQFAQDKLNGINNVNNYSEAPEWAKQQADKYLPIISAAKNLKGKALDNFITNRNLNHSEESKTSYPALIKMKRRYFRYGLGGLLANYGKRAGFSTVKDEYFNYFKNLYLKEGSPSLQSCWDLTLGYAIRTDNQITKDNFPSPITFKRRIEKLIPKQSIYLARYGQSAWNRKYGNYIERDYSNITCGKVWVSDHAQIDVACLSPDGNIVFPWVTAWRDFKSGKWLGWILQCGHPNSDLIFQSFYYAAENYGLPTDVIIDNGKDYRSKDFAGEDIIIKNTKK